MWFRNPGLSAWIAAVALACAAFPGRAADDAPRDGDETAQIRTDDGQWQAGAYAFSDELGGFSILSASGRGTKADPIVLVQEFHSASPVTLTIRAIGPIQPFAHEEGVANGFIRMVVVAVNGSGLVWTQFEFELQETLGQPSVYGDGLSFDQRRREGGSIDSDAFGRFDRAFEPYDRLRFEDGFVDPGKRARFEFLISDFTPVAEFYLVQDPRIPAS
ncbi:MAG: hypothetical protein ACK4U0_18960 [Mesorhizobium sp.]